jgi:hypothetical protein
MYAFCKLLVDAGTAVCDCCCDNIGWVVFIVVFIR